MLKKVNGHLMFTDEFYSFAKKFVQVYLPAIASLYFGLGNIWGFPAIEQVVGSCAVVATFIGVVLGISSASFDKSGAGYDGNVIVHETAEGKKLYSLELNDDHPENLSEKDSLKFKMTPQ